MPKKNALTERVAGGKWGPAMSALRTDHHRAFVLALMEQVGEPNATLAAEVAGFGGESPVGLRVTAHRLIHDDRIQAAIQEEARKRLISGGLMASAELLRIVADRGHKDQLKAIGMLMDRAGMHALTEHKVTVENVSDREALARINQRLAEMGFDLEGRKKFLGRAGITDVEYEEVTADGAAPV